MSEITTLQNWFENEFRQKVEPLIQQTQSAMMPYVTVGSYKGEAASPVKQYGKASFSKITGDFTDTEFTNIEHQRRWVSYERYASNVAVPQGQLMNIMDSESGYEASIRNSMMYDYERTIDKIIIPALGGAAYVGEDYGTTTKALPNSQIVAAAYGSGSGDVGITYAKIAKAAEIFLTNNANVERDPMLLVIHPNIETQLKQIEEFKNSDYISFGNDMSTYKANNPYGMRIIRSTQLNKVGDNYECFVYQKSGMHLGTWQNLVFKVAERPDKNFDGQITAQFAMGATRLEEEKVVKILCKAGV